MNDLMEEGPYERKSINGLNEGEKDVQKRGDSRVILERTVREI